MEGEMAQRHKRVYAPIPLEVERVGKAVLDEAFKVHTALGPGLLESVYETAAAHVMRKQGLLVETQLRLPVAFEGELLGSGLRLDMRVETCVIVEIKSVEVMHSVYDAQLMTYLRLSGIRLGYLINFNVAHLRDGIKRMVV
jgi:GxxExxY protein